MADLSQEQLAQVARWFAAGASLDEIQKRIQSEFGVHLTYLDVRLMVADLPQPAEPEVEEKEPPTVDLEEESASAGDYAEGTGNGADIEGKPGDAAVDGMGGENGAIPGAEGEMQPTGELEVAVDPLAPPGCIACGSVTFGDGTVGKWMLDQMGRLGLSGLPEGYRPSPEDSAQFQPKLVAALRARGLV